MVSGERYGRGPKQAADLRQGGGSGRAGKRDGGRIEVEATNRRQT